LGAGIFVISLLFAAIHFHLPSLIPLLIIASGFSLAYLYTKSLWVPIIMHGLFNGVNLALLLVMRH
jgi:membrane protease YdiL (CAAX protease family)